MCFNSDMEKITSTQNKLIKAIKKLANDKKERDVTATFVAETQRVIETLIANGAKCRNLLIKEQSKAFNYVKKYLDMGIHIDIASPSIFDSVSTLANTDGMIAVFHKQKKVFDVKTGSKYIILDKIQNPGNLGTIIRTSVALNLDGIIITNDSVDLYHPTIIRGTMGSCFSIPIKISTSFKDTIDSLKAKGIKTYATTLIKDAKPINGVVFAPGCAVAFGNEGNGLAERDVKLCDEAVYVPINKNIDSLNVATAAAIVIYKMNN